MKQTIIAASLFAALAVAHVHKAHHHALHGKRQGDDDVVTVTSDVWVTTTTTIMLPPGATAPPNGTDDEEPSSTLIVAVAPVSSATISVAPPVDTPAPAAVQSASQQPVSQQPASAPPAAASPAPQAPAPQAPAPAASSPAPAPAPAPAQSSAAAPAPASVSAASSDNSGPVSGGTSTHMTYYNTYDHTGSCSTPLTDDSHTVAMAASMLQCGKQLKIHGPAGTFTATAEDTCVACATDGHLDIPENFAAQIAGSSAYLTNAGNVPITWEWA